MKEINNYLIFDGNCGEAMQFYARCLGGELQISKFSDAPMPIPEGAKDRIMHARLSKGPALLMASDNMPGMPFQQGNNFSVTVNCETVQEIDQFFAAMGDQGKVTMPLQETFWASRFGMLTDKFGINWMFSLEKPSAK